MRRWKLFAQVKKKKNEKTFIKKIKQSSKTYFYYQSTKEEEKGIEKIAQKAILILEKAQKPAFKLYEKEKRKRK